MMVLAVHAAGMVLDYELSKTYQTYSESVM